MRLLQRKDSSFSLVEFVGKDIPPYSIPSHTWGSDQDEITFRDVIEGTGQQKPGYKKLELCARWAAKDNIHYFWIDTCCIDKSSSAELSEAINSMFRWYRDSARCYVYLTDVSAGRALVTTNEFENSRWFTRGWTLQELIAPRLLDFYSKDGEYLGDRKSLAYRIQRITGIPLPALEGKPLSEFGIDERLSWARNRITKRDEDAAYSLFGLFGVFMPLIYGEGKENAMARLRREIDNKPNPPTASPSSGPCKDQENAISLKTVGVDDLKLAKRLYMPNTDMYTRNFQTRTGLDTARLPTDINNLLLEYSTRLDDTTNLFTQEIYRPVGGDDSEASSILLQDFRTTRDLDEKDWNVDNPLYYASETGKKLNFGLLHSLDMDKYKRKNSESKPARNARRAGSTKTLRKSRSDHDWCVPIRHDEPETMPADMHGDRASVHDWRNRKTPESNEALWRAHAEFNKTLEKLRTEMNTSILTHNNNFLGHEGTILHQATNTTQEPKSPSLSSNEGTQVDNEGDHLGSALPDPPASSATTAADDTHLVESLQSPLTLGAQTGQEAAKHGTLLHTTLHDHHVTIETFKYLVDHKSRGLLQRAKEVCSGYTPGTLLQRGLWRLRMAKMLL